VCCCCGGQQPAFRAAALCRSWHECAHSWQALAAAGTCCCCCAGGHMQLCQWLCISCRAGGQVDSSCPAADLAAASLSSKAAETACIWQPGGQQAGHLPEPGCAWQVQARQACKCAPKLAEVCSQTSRRASSLGRILHSCSSGRRCIRASAFSQLQLHCELAWLLPGQRSVLASRSCLKGRGILLAQQPGSCARPPQAPASCQQPLTRPRPLPPPPLPLRRP
jgi:hypothetical protein